MYIFFLDKMQLPVTPSSLDMKIKSGNKTVTLANGGEINQIKKPELTEITFDALLPNQEYPFAVYKDGFKNAGHFLNQIEKLKKRKTPFQFIVVRTMPDGKPIFDTNIKVTLEDYTITEDAEDYGTDVYVSFNLKQYREYGTRTFKIVKPTPGKPKPPTATKNKGKRPVKKPAKNKIHTVKKGDCLWKISKKYYGKGSLWPTIYKANKKKIKNPNLIYPGQKFIIPPLKK